MPSRTPSPGRRAALATIVAGLIAGPAGAAKAPLVRLARVRWPGAAGVMLHGAMAIPGKARGPQPAVLVLAPADPADPFVTIGPLGAAGLVACALPAPPATIDDALASCRWLATHAFATGRIALLGIDAGAPLAAACAARYPGLAALATIGIEIVPPLGVPARAGGGADALATLIPFLKEQLR